MTPPPRVQEDEAEVGRGHLELREQLRLLAYTMTGSEMGFFPKEGQDPDWPIEAYDYEGGRHCRTCASVRFRGRHWLHERPKGRDGVPVAWVIPFVGGARPFTCASCRERILPGDGQ